METATPSEATAQNIGVDMSIASASPARPAPFLTAVIGDGPDVERRLIAADADAVGRVSVRDALSAAHRFDAAVVGADASAKPDLVEGLLHAGVHVLIEPPFLPDDARFDRIDAAARAHGAFALVAYGHRFEPQHQTLRDLLDGGALGRVFRCRLFCARGARAFSGSASRADARGALLRDLAPRAIDVARYWFGDVVDDLRGAAPCAPNAAGGPDADTVDHVALVAARNRPRLEIELSAAPTRTQFTADLYAAGGSAHVTSHAQWGSDRATVRIRTLRSDAAPEETVSRIARDDVFEAEHLCFRQLARDAAAPCFDDDRRLSRAVRALIDAPVDALDARRTRAGRERAA